MTRETADGTTARGDLGVAAVGAYVPRLALPTETYAEAWGGGGPSGVERTAVPDADEDSLTLAAEAGRRALDAAEIRRSNVGRLLFATTTPPAEEEETTARLASLLGLPEDVVARQYGGSTRAGVAALADAAEGVEPTLVVAADCPAGAPESEAEAAAGAGAGAFLLTADGPLDVAPAGEYTEPYPGTRFRRRGSEETESVGVTSYERDAYRTAVAGALGGVETDALDAVALTAPDGKLPYRAAGSAGITTEQVAAGTVVSQTGDAGVAGPLLGAAAALRNSARRVALVGYGGGAGATAVVAEAEETNAVPVDAALAPSRDLSYVEYARRRGHVTGDGPEGGGAYVSLPSWRRTIPQRHRLVAGRCPDCGELAFPPEGACAGCNSLVSYDPVSLSGEGTVEAATTIGRGGAPPEFTVQQQRAGAFGAVVVAFDSPGGKSVSAPAAVVPDAKTPTVGERVRMVPRRIYEDEGVVRYGFKVVPERFDERPE